MSLPHSPARPRYLKEVARHLLHRLRLDSVIEWRARRRGFAPVSAKADLRSTFSSIYDEGVWVHSTDQASRSGVGSDLATTEQVRAGLRELLIEVGCTTLLDVGCGDLHWLSQANLPCAYVGVDIVPSLIDELSHRHGDRGTFLCLDATIDPLPPADVVLCREVLFHLSFADIQRVLANVRSTGCRYFIATTNDRVGFNADIRSGAFRELNLQRRPIRLGRPERLIPDGGIAPGRSLAVWAL